MAAGTPYLVIQASKRALAQSAAVMAARGTASTHREVRSIIVKIY
jgi:hypothetical protein